MKEILHTQLQSTKLDNALQQATKQKKGAPVLDILSNSDKLLIPKNMPDYIKSEMQSKFNANLSHVKLYESNLVNATGANAYAGGSSIAFAPGKLDFSSFEGKKLLGHELSHVAHKTDEHAAELAGNKIAKGESASSDFSFSSFTPMAQSHGISDFSGSVSASKGYFSGKKMMRDFNKAETNDDQLNLLSSNLVRNTQGEMGSYEQKMFQKMTYSMRNKLDGDENLKSKVSQNLDDEFLQNFQYAENGRHTNQQPPSIFGGRNVQKGKFFRASNSEFLASHLGLNLPSMNSSNVSNLVSSRIRYSDEEEKLRNEAKNSKDKGAFKAFSQKKTFNDNMRRNRYTRFSTDV